MMCHPASGCCAGSTDYCRVDRTSSFNSRRSLPHSAWEKGPKALEMVAALWSRSGASAAPDEISAPTTSTGHGIAWPQAAAAAPTGYVCRASGSDRLSGLAALFYSVNGGAWTAVPSNGTFALAHGVVRALATEQTDRQIAQTLNGRFLRTGTGKRFARLIVRQIREAYAIPSLFQHLRAAGWLTTAEVAAQLQTLPARQRDVLQSIAVDSASIKDTAAKFSMSEGAVWVALHRGLAGLTAKLREQ